MPTRGNALIVRPLRTFLQKAEGAAHLLAAKLPSPPVTLTGDRAIEWSWVAGKMPQGPGKALEFGPGSSHMGLVATRRGYDVVAVDLRQPFWPYVEPKLKFVQGDLFDLELEAGSFDIIINCSTIEHVGLAGRYGVARSRPDGDLEAMQLLRRLIRPGGVQLLTIPVGQDAVFAPLHRVYGPERLPRLLEGWAVQEEEFWCKDPANRWARVEKSVALQRVPEATLYGLGCFVLRPGEPAA